MRTTPLWFSPSFLNETDILLRGCLESILNTEFDDSSRSLANLPIRVGGLGIRRISDICLPAFLASTYGVFNFVKSQIHSHGDEIEICHVSEAFQQWSTITSYPDPPPNPEHQKSWDQINVSRINFILSA